MHITLTKLMNAIGGVTFLCLTSAFADIEIPATMVRSLDYTNYWLPGYTGFGGATPFVSFAVFDLSIPHEPITQATLRLFADSVDTSGTLALWDYSGDVPALAAGIADPNVAFWDLSSGLRLGSITVTASGPIVLSINSAGVDLLNSVSGAVAIGINYEVPWIVNQPSFLKFNTDTMAPRLELITVPEPSTYAAAVCYLAILGMWTCWNRVRS